VRLGEVVATNRKAAQNVSTSKSQLSASGDSIPPARGWTVLGRGLRLLCPKCGGAPIFRGWFAMHDRCLKCGRRFNRAPGYLLGSIYVNYGVTALLVVVTYFSLYFGEVLDGKQLLIVLTAFSVVFPLWFFRYARSLWIAFDERWDPWPNEQEARAEALRRPAAR
jgi:uncharacterized protein (DUF983 family)